MKWISLGAFHHCPNIIVNIKFSSAWDNTVSTTLHIALSTSLFVHMQTLNNKLEQNWETINYLQRGLWTMKILPLCSFGPRNFFCKNLKSFPAPFVATYLMYILLKWKIKRKFNVFNLFIIQEQQPLKYDYMISFYLPVS